MGRWQDDRDNVIMWQGGGAEPPFPVTFTGRDGRVTIGVNCGADQPSITLGDACELAIGDDCRVARLEVFAAANTRVAIGDRSGFTWRTRLYAHEAFDISIGRDCLFSDGVWLTVSDMHSIVDRASGLRINRGGAIVVGDAVWIGHSAVVLKGARIGAGSVVGTGSVVAGDLPDHCVAAGVPARIVRRDIEWRHELV